MGLDMYLEKRIKNNEMKEVVYWRKANQIHNWFVKNVQGGNDNCETYEVNEQKIKELINVCEEVIVIFNKATMKKGKIKNGQYFDSLTGWRDNLEDGIIYEGLDVERIKEILPSQSGFFFGGTNYDEYYLNDVEMTLRQLKELDFKDKYYYTSSW